MSTQQTKDTTESTTERTIEDETPSTRTLFSWLDEQPNFVTVERTHRVRSKDSGTAVQYGSRDKDVTQQMFVHPDYELTTRACHGTQNEVMSAWEDMKFPSHRIESIKGVTGAYLYSRSTDGNANMFGFRRRRGNDDESPGTTINFDAVQHPDGHGIVQHYSTIAAIRTKNGLVIANEQDHAGGFAKVTRPDESDATLPLTGIDDVLNGHSETLYDISEIVRDAVSIRPNRSYNSETGDWEQTGFSPARSDEQNTLIRLSTGAAVMLLIDSTAMNRHERKCGFYIPPEEAPLYETASDAAKSLQPISVQQAINAGRFDITPADKYVEGGATFDNESLLGSTIIRQGEWYLVPMAEGWNPTNPTLKALPKATRKSDWDFSNVEMTDFFDVTDAIDGFPESCPNCGESQFEIAARKPTAACEACGDRFVFGEFNPDDYVTEELADDYSNALDTLDSHTPRDLAVENGDIFIRGTFRHTRQEHQMINLKDRWHIAVENTRDVTVFNLNLNRGGGVARYE